MSIKPEDVAVHKEGMPGKDDKEGLVQLVDTGRVEAYSWEGAFNKARGYLTDKAAKLGVKDVYYFRQIDEMPSDRSYEVTVEAFYDPNSIKGN